MIVGYLLKLEPEPRIQKMEDADPVPQNFY